MRDSCESRERERCIGYQRGIPTFPTEPSMYERQVMCIDRNHHSMGPTRYYSFIHSPQENYERIDPFLTMYVPWGMVFHSGSTWVNFSVVFVAALFALVVVVSLLMV